MSTQETLVEAIAQRMLYEGEMIRTNLLLTALLVKMGGSATLTVEEVETVLKAKITTYASNADPELKEHGQRISLTLKSFDEMTALLSGKREEPLKEELFFMSPKAGTS